MQVLDVLAHANSQKCHSTWVRPPPRPRKALKLTRTRTTTS